ncbi:Uncharacterised protein [Kluyvera cryocrescens]|uniref:Uncharacterized protein n=1 Tax=Kluyvera cryocrescens TaxID=580 RepID=A0A485BRU2_KLUCR|nr:Uncharacterised protein [Kluyvera cryocrescens]
MGILDGFTQAQASGKDSVKKVGIGGYSMFARVKRLHRVSRAGSRRCVGRWQQCI